MALKILDALPPELFLLPCLPALHTAARQSTLAWLLYTYATWNSYICIVITRTECDSHEWETQSVAAAEEQNLNLPICWYQRSTKKESFGFFLFLFLAICLLWITVKRNSHLFMSYTLIKQRTGNVCDLDITWHCASEREKRAHTTFTMINSWTADTFLFQNVNNNKGNTHTSPTHNIFFLPLIYDLLGGEMSQSPVFHSESQGIAWVLIYRKK